MKKAQDIKILSTSLFILIGTACHQGSTFQMKEPKEISAVLAYENNSRAERRMLFPELKEAAEASKQCIWNSLTAKELSLVLTVKKAYENPHTIEGDEKIQSVMKTCASKYYNEQERIIDHMITCWLEKNADKICLKTDIKEGVKNL